MVRSQRLWLVNMAIGVMYLGLGLCRQLCLSLSPSLGLRLRLRLRLYLCLICFVAQSRRKSDWRKRKWWDKG